MLSETLYQNTVCGYTLLTDGISKEHQTLPLISCNLNTSVCVLYCNILTQTTEAEIVFLLSSILTCP